MRAIRFCMVTTFYPPSSFGGDGVYVERLAHALADRGHHVTVVHSVEAFRALNGSRSRAGAGHPGVKVIPIDAGLGRVSPAAIHLTGRPLLTARPLARALDGDFDVLHFHNPSLIGGPAALQMGAGLKLYTLHEQWLLCPTHVLFKYQRRVCEKPQCWRCSMTYGRPPQLWRHGRLLERSLAEVDVLIAPSRTVARLHERFAAITTIAHLNHFAPEPREDQDAATNERPPYFLFAGRLEPVKGVHNLLEAFRRRDEELLVAGDGSLLPSLRKAAADLPNVHFMGWVGPAELATLYRGALSVILPTLGHESFPLVPLEAMSRGTPGILRRFGALAEIAEQSGGALTYRSGDELDAAIDRVASDPSLRRTLGERGRAAYLKHWTEDIHLSAYFGLIEDAARRRGDQGLAAAAEQAGASSPQEAG